MNLPLAPGRRRNRQLRGGGEEHHCLKALTLAFYGYCSI